MNELEYLGRGLRYPFTNNVNGDLLKAKELHSVVSSINRIIDTPLGSMPMNRTLGTQLERLVFESNEALISQAARIWLKEQILQNEPRVSNVEIFVYFIEPNNTDIRTKYTAVSAKAAIINVAYIVTRYNVPQVVSRPLQILRS